MAQYLWTQHGGSELLESSWKNEDRVRFMKIRSQWDACFRFQSARHRRGMWLRRERGSKAPHRSVRWPWHHLRFQHDLRQRYCRWFLLESPPLRPRSQSLFCRWCRATSSVAQTSRIRILAREARQASLADLDANWTSWEPYLLLFEAFTSLTKCEGTWWNKWRWAGKT